MWLETVNEPSTTDSSNNGKTHKKLSKKKQRQRNRRLSDVSPPWPNANSDILCEHQNLQRCSAKAARSRRKLMDKHSWKVLRKLYPDSTTLESVRGECLQCLMETEAAKKTESDRLEQEKMERKKPLANALVRQFYTRTKGVPMHCLVDNINSGVAGTCPLVCGKYVILPRSWCHQWRRYVKTGEGSLPLPPDSSALLCDAHKLALLPVCTRRINRISSTSGRTFKAFSICLVSCSFAHNNISPTWKPSCVVRPLNSWPVSSTILSLLPPFLMQQ